LLKAFENDEDLHAFTAERLGISREAGKTVNFSIVYGVGSQRLASSLNIKVEEADELIASFFDTYKNVYRLKEYVKYKVERQRMVKTYFGRRRYFEPPFTDEIHRQAFNFCCQGTAIDIVKSAMGICYKAKLDAIPILQVHDEIVFECPLDSAQDTARKIKTLIESNPLTSGLPVKFPVQIGIGRNWEEAKEKEVS